MVLVAKKAVVTKRPVGRPKGSKNTTVVTAPTKKALGRPRKHPVVVKDTTKLIPKPAQGTYKKAGRPKIPIGTEKGMMDKLTNMSVGSDQYIIAYELMEGGSTRQEIVERLRTKIDPLTKSGTEKAIANLVSAVFNRLMKQGFLLEASYKVLPPTPASKRKATRLANQAKTTVEE